LTVRVKVYRFLYILVNGLYWTDFKGEPKLLSEKYEASVNYYDNAVYFIDDESHIQKVDLKDNKAETVVKSNVSSILIIDDIMYYIQQMGENMHSLFGLELKTRKVKELASGVDMEYLYDCWGFAGVIIQEKNQLAICSYAGGIEQKQDILENQSLVGFLPDRSIIYSEAADEGDEIGIYCKKDFTDTNPKLLIEKENIHHIILHKDEMVFTVLNQNGPIEVYQYDFQTEKCNKIGNTNYDISDFNEEYVVSCYDDAIGVVNLIERKTGKCIPMSDQ
ncbi:MAG: hypothetical protein Q4F21_07530, partial [Lachnospiraceae bacterium]|nr:hypothetical protein [Lachnospiraceae bacterium]